MGHGSRRTPGAKDGEDPEDPDSEPELVDVYELLQLIDRRGELSGCHDRLIRLNLKRVKLEGVEI